MAADYSLLPRFKRLASSSLLQERCGHWPGSVWCVGHLGSSCSLATSWLCQLSKSNLNSPGFSFLDYKMRGFSRLMALRLSWVKIQYFHILQRTPQSQEQGGEESQRNGSPRPLRNTALICWASFLGKKFLFLKKELEKLPPKMITRSPSSLFIPHFEVIEITCKMY